MKEGRRVLTEQQDATDDDDANSAEDAVENGQVHSSSGPGRVLDALAESDDDEGEQVRGAVASY